jgi:glycosyltransferase involved in cell wall biosynthesis
LESRTSIVVTSYNQRDQLAEAVQSALAQTLRPREVVVADDASSDGSPELIRELAARHPGLVRGVFQPQNLGIPRNRNAGLAAAGGELVALLDGDDRLLPGFLERLEGRLAGEPQAGCAYANVRFVDARGVALGLRDRAPLPSGDVRGWLAEGRMGLLRAMLIRRELLALAGGLDQSFPKHDGFVLTLRLARLTRFAYVGEPLVEYRVHPGSDSHAITPAERVRHLEAVRAEVLRSCQDLPGAALRRIRGAWRRRLLTWRVRALLRALLGR